MSDSVHFAYIYTNGKSFEADLGVRQAWRPPPPEFFVVPEGMEKGSEQHYQHLATFPREKRLTDTYRTDSVLDLQTYLKGLLGRRFAATSHGREEQRTIEGFVNRVPAKRHELMGEIFRPLNDAEIAALSEEVQGYILRDLH